MDDFAHLDSLIRTDRPDVPVTCFRPAALETAARWFIDNIPGHALYAVKANPAPYVIEGLYKAGIRHFDAASVHEIELVRRHAPGCHIGFMHPVKSRLAIEQAYFDHGVRDFSFDSMAELEKIVACTGDSKDLTLLLRLAVPNSTAELPLSDKFGASPMKAGDLLKAARKVAMRIGICFHVGSQTMDPATYTNALSIVGGIMRSIPRTRVDIVDIGGGFPAIYPGMVPPAMAAYRDAIVAGIQSLPNHDRIEIWCEPGRALVAESASVVVKVEARKGDTLYINDGTYGSLFDAGHLGFRYPTRLIRAAARKSVPKQASQKGFRFYGPTCDSIDFMPGPFFLPADVQEGDYIEIGQLGAYGNAMRTNFNGFYTHEVVEVTAPPLLSVYAEPVTGKRKAATALCVA